MYKATLDILYLIYLPPIASFLLILLKQLQLLLFLSINGLNFRSSMADDNCPSKDAANGSSTPIKEVELSGKSARNKLAELLSKESLNPVDSESPKEYKFWKTQPVPQMGQAEELESMKDGGKPFKRRTSGDIPKQPYALIDAFEWSDVDVTEANQLEEAYRLLNENYVEDGEAMFRFDYSQDFLRWALLPPGWEPSFHVGVRVKTNKKLVAFITAVPANIKVHKKVLPMVEINFLCVHKKLRSKRLAPVLIREITRRVNMKGMWQAVYTAGTLLPRPVSTSHYYHRSLNPKKLIESGFSRLKPRMTIARTIKLYALRTETEIPGIRPMRAIDIPEACTLLREHMKNFDLSSVMCMEEFSHWLLPRDGVVYTYVVENPEAKKITDLVSFYSLPSSIINNPNHKSLSAAYAFCIVPAQTPIAKLMKDALVLARNNKFDVFNALDIGQNAPFFDELKFHVGNGELNYYLYNWKCCPVPKEKNALVLL